MQKRLFSVLRQLRDGYPNRPKAFPQSVDLIGLRDVRDYKVAAGGSDRRPTSSPFNIKVRSITLRDFNAEDESIEITTEHILSAKEILINCTKAWLFNWLCRLWVLCL